MNKVFCSWLYTVQPKRITDRPETPSYEESDVLRLQEVRVDAPRASRISWPTQKAIADVEAGEGKGTQWVCFLCNYRCLNFSECHENQWPKGQDRHPNPWLSGGPKYFSAPRSLWEMGSGGFRDGCPIWYLMIETHPVQSDHKNVLCHPQSFIQVP